MGEELFSHLSVLLICIPCRLCFPWTSDIVQQYHVDRQCGCEKEREIFKERKKKKDCHTKQQPVRGRSPKALSFHRT